MLNQKPVSVQRKFYIKIFSTIFLVNANSAFKLNPQSFFSILVVGKEISALSVVR